MSVDLETMKMLSLGLVAGVFSGMFGMGGLIVCLSKGPAVLVPPKSTETGPA